MKEENICPKCGKTMAASGACPRCLADFAMSDTDAGKKAESPSDEPILPNDSFIGPYKIAGLIGRGGMGTVYKAYQSSLDRFVAVKVLPAKLSSDPEFLKRFNREAKALARLSHPNIVPVYDMGQAGNSFYFVMEFVEGVALRDLIADKKLLPAEALALVPQLCDALEYAHSEGVIHRDIKPENLLIDKKGRIKIADFGLARIVKGDVQSDPLTKTNEVMGTFDYMAPEQRTRTKDTDHRVDIYSLGVVFYEMLTGELPIGRFELPSRKVQIDVRLDDVVLKALEQEPSKRYQRASDVGTAVSKIVSEPAPAEAVSSEGRGKSGYDPLSIFSFVLSLIPLGITQILGIIFGIVGIRRINRSKEQLKGTGLAIAGIALSTITLIPIVFILMAIMVPSFLKDGRMAVDREMEANQKTAVEALQRLALAQEIYCGGDLQEGYAESIKDVCKYKVIAEIISLDTDKIAAADEVSMGANARPCHGYFFRVIPWGLSGRDPWYRSGDTFVIAAYPEKPSGKTFVVDARRIVYSKSLGNLRYPNTWQTLDDKNMETDPARDGWVTEKRLELEAELKQHQEEMKQVKVERAFDGYLEHAKQVMGVDYKGRYIEAIYALNEALKIKDDNQAKELLKQCELQQSKELEPLLADGKKLMGEGGYEEAIKIFNQALKVKDDNQIKELIKQCQGLVEQKKQQAQAQKESADFLEFGKALMDNREYARAIGTFNKALQLKDDNQTRELIKQCEELLKKQQQQK
ncbi:MAG: protein kinase [Planctomycetota bacterium]